MSAFIRSTRLQSLIFIYRSHSVKQEVHLVSNLPVLFLTNILRSSRVIELLNFNTGFPE